MFLCCEIVYFKTNSICFNLGNSVFKYLLCVSKDGDFGQKISLKVAFILASWGVVKATFLNTRNYSILY